jgi:hypothetical protein
MPDAALAKKLAIKPNSRALIMNAPDENYVQAMALLPEGVQVETGDQTASDGSLDFILLFVRDKAEIDGSAPGAVRALKAGGVLWFAYPKKTSKVKTDITRDVGWEAVFRLGWRPVTQIAIDDTWSALRFRPEADVKPRKA